VKKTLFVYFIISVVFLSCKKTETNIGREILPDEDLLGATYCDTSTIVAYTILDDSLRTDESYIGYIPQLVGSMADPIFGRTDASLFMNFTNPNNTTNIGFGSEAKLDSVVLTLAYQKDKYYGDKNDPLLFNVYRLTQSIYFDSAYYSYSNANYNQNEDITYSGNGFLSKIDPTTSVYEGDVAFSPHIRIRLKNEIGQQFIDDSTKLASTSSLLDFFKGICVTTKNTTISSTDYGFLAYFDLTSPLSKITIYYHNGLNATTKKLDLTIRNNSARFNKYTHDYTLANPNFTQQLPPINNKQLGKQNLFMQGMAGSKIKIELPHISNFSDSGKIAINKAELILKTDKNSSYYDETKFFSPSRAMLEGINSLGQVYGLSFDQSYDLTGLWGYYDAANHEFHFPIPYSIQKMVNKTQTNSFTLRIFQNHSMPSRIVLGGNNNSTYPLKLKLWYTKVEK
jgi:hypothetical protein